MADREKVIKGLECCVNRDPGNMPRCAECTYYHDYCLRDLKRDALELLKERQWISVKDRLPEHGQTVLAWEVSGFVYVDNYDGEHDIFKIAYNNGGTVTHWQSLPEPPKEGENG